MSYAKLLTNVINRESYIVRHYSIVLENHALGVPIGNFMVEVIFGNGR